MSDLNILKEFCLDLPCLEFLITDHPSDDVKTLLNTPIPEMGNGNILFYTIDAIDKTGTPALIGLKCLEFFIKAGATTVHKDGVSALYNWISTYSHNANMALIEICIRRFTNEFAHPTEVVCLIQDQDTVILQCLIQDQDALMESNITVSTNEFAHPTEVVCLIQDQDALMESNITVSTISEDVMDPYNRSKSVPKVRRARYNHINDIRDVNNTRQNNLTKLALAIQTKDDEMFEIIVTRIFESPIEYAMECLVDIPTADGIIKKYSLIVAIIRYGTTLMIDELPPIRVKITNLYIKNLPKYTLIKYLRYAALNDRAMFDYIIKMTNCDDRSVIKQVQSDLNNLIITDANAKYIKQVHKSIDALLM
jgi:hypothetical protein